MAAQSVKEGDTAPHWHSDRRFLTESCLSDDDDGGRGLSDAEEVLDSVEDGFDYDTDSGVNDSQHESSRVTHQEGEHRLYRKWFNAGVPFRIKCSVLTSPTRSETIP